MMGRKPGRVCFLYQIDFSEVTLEFYSKTPIESISGTIESYEDFYSAISRILEFHKTDRVEVGLKRIGIKGKTSRGICVKSFPQTKLTAKILSMLNLCLGGQNGTELVHLPESGTIFDQSNIFIESFYIYVDEVSKYNRIKRIEKKEDTKKSSR